MESPIFQHPSFQDEALKSSEQKEPLSSRRHFFKGFLLPFSLATKAYANTEVLTADEIAKQYIKAYYIDYDVKKAFPLTSGLAKEKLKEQLKLLQEVSGQAPFKKPQSHFSLKSKKVDGAQEASYIYLVEVDKQDISARRIFLKLRKENSQGWKVTQFVEAGQSPALP